jgi:hypothetical protein
MGKACLPAASVETALNGCRKTRFFPINEYLFREHDFIIQEAQTTAAGGNLSISG